MAVNCRSRNGCSDGWIRRRGHSEPDVCEEHIEAGDGVVGRSSGRSRKSEDSSPQTFAKVGMAAAMDGSEEEDMLDLMSVKNTLKQAMVSSAGVVDEVERVKIPLPQMKMAAC